MNANHFQTYFDVVVAKSGPLLEEVFRLRHKVYCEELGYEPQRASRLEHDEYDKRSIHCLLAHKASNAYIGCVRLILADSSQPESPFPFEPVCGESLRWSFDNAVGTGRERYGEISRLAVISRFRRLPRKEYASSDGYGQKFRNGNDDERHLIPNISMGLYLAMAAIVMDQGLKGVFAMMEPRLARRLRRLDILFDQVGDAVSHHGMRGPFVSHCDDANLDTMKPDIRALFGKIQNCLATQSVQTL